MIWTLLLVLVAVVMALVIAVFWRARQRARERYSWTPLITGDDVHIPDDVRRAFHHAKQRPGNPFNDSQARKSPTPGAQ